MYGLAILQDIKREESVKKMFFRMVIYKKGAKNSIYLLNLQRTNSKQNMGLLECCLECKLRYFPLRREAEGRHLYDTALNNSLVSMGARTVFCK